MGIRGAHGLLVTHQAHLGAAWATLKFHFLGVLAGLGLAQVSALGLSSSSLVL